METGLTKRVESAGSLTTASLKKQMELLRDKFHLPETMIETHYIRTEWVPDPKAQKPDCRKAVMKGSEEDRHNGMVPRYTLCKRENPIRIYDLSGSDGAVAAVTSFSYAGMMGMTTPPKGKYNDETRLEILNNFETGVDIGEVGAVASI